MLLFLGGFQFDSLYRQQTPRSGNNSSSFPTHIDRVSTEHIHSWAAEHLQCMLMWTVHEWRGKTPPNVLQYIKLCISVPVFVLFFKPNWITAFLAWKCLINTRFYLSSESEANFWNEEKKKQSISINLFGVNKIDDAKCSFIRKLVV